MKIVLKKTGITNTDAEIVVNAANSSLHHGGGVCGVIFNAAGADDLAKACNKIAYCKTGDAVLTEGFALSKYIIHAVGPMWSDGNHHEPQDLYSCYRKSLDLMMGAGCSSIAFPLISAGIFSYPLDKACRKALQACDDWNRDNGNPNGIIIFTIPEDYKYEEFIKQAKDLPVDIEY